MGPETRSARRINGGVVATFVGVALFGAGVWEGFINGPSTRDQIMRDAPACSGVGDLESMRYYDLQARVENSLLYSPRNDFESLARDIQFVNLRDCLIETRNRVQQAGLGPSGWKLPLLSVTPIVVGTVAASLGLAHAVSKTRTF